MSHRFARVEMSGQRFGRLVVLSYAGLRQIGTKSNNQSQWLCRCDCGNEKTVLRSSLIRGATKSCGCARGGARGDARRGQTLPEYYIWLGMRKRCNNPNTRQWHHYGGRGIKVCERWQNDYQAFLADVGRRPSGKHSLDRINNDGHYEPGNVRWATAKEQIHNRRKVQRKNWHECATHAYAVVESFEAVMASYTGAPFVVALDSCTAALHLCCEYLKVRGQDVEIPKYTYVGVPQSIIHAGGRVRFRDEAWVGMYRLEPFPIYDCARLLTSKMYKPGAFMCLSFHWAKHLPIGRGGAILCDDIKARDWFRRAAFDGRTRGRAITPKNVTELGWHYYFTPPQAAQGLMLMTNLAERNDPLPNSDYPDLSQFPIFQRGHT